MNLEIFEKENRTRVNMIKTFTFITYNDKFNGIGTFQMSIPYTEESLKDLTYNNYIYFEKGVMGIIKYRKKSQDNDTVVEIRGFLLNRILKYRYFLKTADYKGKMAEVSIKMIKDLMVENEDERRNISFLTFSEMIPDSPDFVGQVTGKPLNETIETMFLTAGYGYQITPVLSKYNEETGILTNIQSFEYNVLRPADRSIDNTDGNTPIVFSMQLNNLRSLSFEEDAEEYCNVCIVAGEGEGVNRKTVEIGETEAVGLERIEFYVDARDLQSENEETGKVMSAADYENALKARGEERMQEHAFFRLFSGSIIQGDIRYKYGVDFFKGDYVSVNDEQLNISARLQITEVEKSLTREAEYLDITFGYDRLELREIIERRGLV